MSMEQALAFLVFAIVAAVTPGPSNLMLTAAGAQGGVLRGLSCLLGVTTGMGFMMFLVPLGLASLVLGHPLVLWALHWGGAAFLLWLSWKIATAGRTDATTRSSLLVFGEQPPFNGSTPSRGSSVSAGLAPTCALKQVTCSPRR